MSSTDTAATHFYKHKWQVLISVMMGTIMGLLGGSIVNIFLPAINSLILLYGRLGDMLGCKRIFIYPPWHPC